MNKSLCHNLYIAMLIFVWADTALGGNLQT